MALAQPSSTESPRVAPAQPTESPGVAPAQPSSTERDPTSFTSSQSSDEDGKKISCFHKNDLHY